MKTTLCAALLAVLVGCSQDSTYSPTGPNATQDAATVTPYAEALRIYSDELEVLNHLEEVERRRAKKFQEDLDRIFYESSLTPDEAEERAKPVSAKSRKERLAAEAEIAEQRERVERAKAELKAAESRRD